MNDGMMKFSLKYSCCWAGLFLFSLTARAVESAPIEIQMQDIAVQPTEGCNLELEDAMSANRAVLTVSSHVHNFFAGVLTHLDTEDETTLGFSMVGNDSTTSQASVAKWQGLKSLYSYAPFSAYETYLWYQKDERGHWISSDIFITGGARDAGTGKFPEQHVIPIELEEAFLSADAKYWSAWAETDVNETAVDLNIYRIRQRFAAAQAVVAMRVPYVPVYEAAFLQRLQKANISGVTVHHIGKSEQQRDLSVIEITDPDAKADTKARPVVMLYGAEDGDEPDGAWLVHGAVQWLISDDPRAAALRKQVTFLCIPLVDPDGAAQCTYATLTYAFAMKKADAVVRPEVLAYTKFVTAWMAAGRRLDLVCNYHNIECSEGPNVLCPIIDLRRAQVMNSLNTFILARLSGVHTSPQTWMTGYADDRFMGWCSKHWGSLQIAYEINSRYPNNRLSLMQLQELGASYARAFGEYLQSDLFKAVLSDIERVRRQHLQERQRFWAQRDDPDEPRTAYEIVTLGF